MFFPSNSEMPAPMSLKDMTIVKAITTIANAFNRNVRIHAKKLRSIAGPPTSADIAKCANIMSRYSFMYQLYTVHNIKKLQTIAASMKSKPNS